MMSEDRPREVSMHVTVYFRDALKDAIAAINRRFPHHTITEFQEIGHTEMLQELQERHVWHGYYENWPLQWAFVVEKRDPDAPGPSRAEVLIHPMFDVIFKDFKDVFFVEIGFKDKPATFRVAGTSSPALDAHVFFNPDGDL